MTAYYNEIDPHAAEWLRNLIAAGHIAPGDVDERSIVDVRPDEIRGYTQCHFFAGIGIWSLALRRAGWPDARPVWTGSCPCQPFSGAGKGEGFDDERHLWPAWHHLLRECRPPAAFGEQVEGKDGKAWFDLVSSDLEADAYAIGAVIAPAAGFGAPHQRHRQYWAAHDLRLASGGVVHGPRRGSQGHGGDGDRRDQPGRNGAQSSGSTAATGSFNQLADAPGRGRGKRGDETQPRKGGHANGSGNASSIMADTASEQRNAGGIGTEGEQPGSFGGPARPRVTEQLADTGSQRRQQDAGSALGDEASDGGKGWDERQSNRDHQLASDGPDCRPMPTNNLWADADWLFCRDGKWRPVEPGTFPLAHGASSRVGRLRAYGNGLCLAQAQGFVEAYLERDMVDLRAEPAGDLFEGLL